MKLLLTAAIAAFLVPAGLAAAQPHASDVILKVDGGHLLVGRVESGSPQFPRFIFSAVFGDTGIPNATFNPGYDSENGALPPSQEIGLTIRRALRVWDGEGFPEIPPERIEIVRATTISTPAKDPPDCATGDSVTLGLVNPAGRVHIHPAYQLTAPAAAGIYLLELQAWLTTPGTLVSSPFWVLFNQGESPATLAEALEWAEQNLAAPAACYANCDGSTNAPVLNVNDFVCFQQRFAAGDCRANCDQSIAPPVLNVNDFVCFQQRFASGCP